MSDFIPDGYIELREALDRVGRYEFPSEWTGDELDAVYKTAPGAASGGGARFYNPREQFKRKELPPAELSHIRAQQRLAHEHNLRLDKRRAAAEQALWQALQGGMIAGAYVHPMSGHLVALKAPWWRSDEGREALRRRRPPTYRAAAERPILLLREDVRKTFGSPPRTATKIKHDGLVEFLNRCADGIKTESACRLEAENHFKRTISDSSSGPWRPAWREVPDEKKRPRGRTRDH